MTGLERNAAVVHMASYAPLLAHVDAWQWRPDLIWFDNLNVAGTPNYYVQKLFSTHRGTQVVRVLKDGQPLTGSDSLYASATIDVNENKVFLKIINTSASVKPLKINLEGQNFLKTGEIETLKAAGLYEYNTIGEPRKIFPASRQILIKGKATEIIIEPRSANVIILGFRK
jgi:alpha-N-arabinofuranosidase